MRPQEPSRSLRRRLRSHAARVEAVHTAEAAYQYLLSTEPPRQKGKIKRGSAKRIDAAFGALIDAVVALQASQIEVLSLTEDEGMAPQAAGPLGEAFESADREYAGYLAARTYEQVREAAARGALQT